VRSEITVLVAEKGVKMTPPVGQGEPPCGVKNGAVNNDNNGVNASVDSGSGEKKYVEYTYRSTDSGPYRVMVQATKDEYINRMKVGLELNRSGYEKTVDEIKKVGKTTCIVYLSNGKEANKLATNKQLLQKGYKCFIPRHFVSTKGVLTRVDKAFSESEIRDNLKTDVQVIDIYRLHKFVDGKKEPINRVTITFRCNRLPQYVSLFLCRVKVEPFVPKTMFCSNCLRYGHRSEHCKNSKLCGKCSGPAHGVETECCVKCRVCGTDEHETKSKECPEYKKQEAINKLKATSGLTYHEVKDNLRVSNRYDVLARVDEFPALQETYAGAVKSSNINSRLIVKKSWKPKDKGPEPGSSMGNEPAKESVARNSTTRKRKRDENGGLAENPHRTTDLQRYINTLSKQDANILHHKLEFTRSSDEMNEKVRELLHVVLCAIEERNKELAEAEEIEKESTEADVEMQDEI
jgi:hypothetical protein